MKCNRYVRARQKRVTKTLCSDRPESGTYLDDAMPPRMKGPEIHIALVDALGPQHLDPVGKRRAARSKTHTRQAKRPVKPNEKSTKSGAMNTHQLFQECHKCLRTRPANMPGSSAPQPKTLRDVLASVGLASMPPPREPKQMQPKAHPPLPPPHIINWVGYEP